MHDLFCCRNCVHNCSQSANIGPGIGYCLQHNSIIHAPDDTTCKYLHRKDLPVFVVDEGIREHAAEYAMYSGLVSLSSGQPVQRGFYSEKHAWESDTFDGHINALAHYHRTERAWVFIEAYASGIDGRRSLTHSSLVRRYMDNCGTWTSSYRLVLACLQDVDAKPSFESRDLVLNGDDVETTRNDALWDVMFVRISGIQEYGFHAGLEDLMWATDAIGESLAGFDWDEFHPRIKEKKEEWVDLIQKHAKDEGVFFAKPEEISHEQ
jgi:hypothetical protein